MWFVDEESLGPDRMCLRLSSARGALGFGEVLRLWNEDESFREFFLDVLRSSQFSSYRWETPPVTRKTIERPFEFVFLDCPMLERAPEPSAFAEHFSAEVIATFSNLGNDAKLVVPSPVGAPSCYSHLGAFLRMGPPEQAHALLRAVAQAMEERIGERPVWLSTAGSMIARSTMGTHRIGLSPSELSRRAHRGRPRARVSARLPSAAALSSIELTQVGDCVSAVSWATLALHVPRHGSLAGWTTQLPLGKPE